MNWSCVSGFSWRKQEGEPADLEVKSRRPDGFQRGSGKNRRRLYGGQQVRQGKNCSHRPIRVEAYEATPLSEA
ncbi:hypothetical protein Y032_0880g2833 [Ancylostoma ceylanicum]|uniref:Uncharacterized protein n=1 Tax=Ancylostoma ceylanicum TaxID=53326 RepID=A0A016WAE4_9BILA|nr:hypothetical protein Y032_0880g2833 [Ancylostoma ceylanicum]